MTAATSTHMTGAVTSHVGYIYQSCTIDRRGTMRGLTPSLAIYAQMDWRKSRQDRKYAIGRAEIPTPNPLASAIDKTDGHCRHGGTSEHQQCRLGIFVNAD